MKELLYDINSGLISGLLFASMALAIEAGVRIGLRTTAAANEATKSHVNAIQGSILGILALLLGFTFSLSLQRFDTRSEAVVDEANAIGTAYLRALLLPVPLRQDVQALLRDYVDLRIRAGGVTVVKRLEREEVVAQTVRAQAALWGYARQAAEANPNPVTSGLFIQSLNELIDSFGKAEAGLHRHVPEVVLLLLYGTFVMAGVIVGFSAGLAGHRPSMVSYVMVALMVVLVFIILDLDRPRRGLIEVSQASMVELRDSIRDDPRPAGRAAVPATTGRPANAGKP